MIRREVNLQFINVILCGLLFNKILRVIFFAYRLLFLKIILLDILIGQPIRSIIDKLQ